MKCSQSQMPGVISSWKLMQSNQIAKQLPIIGWATVHARSLLWQYPDFPRMMSSNQGECVVIILQHEYEVVSHNKMIRTHTAINTGE